MAGAGKTCSIEGCDAPHDAKGLCRKHYGKWRRYGDPVHPSRSVGTPHQFLLDVLLRDETDECIVWPFAKAGQGYGHIVVSGKSQGVHRLICQIRHGHPPGQEFQAAHSCGKGHLGCINPKHLRWATAAQNQHDRIVHGTHCRGENAPQSKLTEEKVKQVRELISRGTPHTQIAAQFGVNSSAIYQIAAGKTWRWLK